jgi:uncharacterized cupredoxin-like copper-binding protein
MRHAKIRLAAAAAAGLLVAGCGGADDSADDAPETSASTDTSDDSAEDGAEDDAMDEDMDEDSDMDDDMDMDEDMDMSGSYGEPAEASEAERTIEVAVDNDLAFKPDEFEVAAGEVVTFRIANSGDIEHEFVLGDEQAQEQMAEEMAEGDDDGHEHSGEMSNAVTIHPGEEAELTWRFPDESTTVLIGCHLPGHYEGGMQGSVTVG